MSNHLNNNVIGNRLLNAGVVCLTETQLLPGQSTERIEENLPEFAFFYNHSCDRFQSLAYFVRPSVIISSLW